MEERTTALQLEEGRLVELRSELASVPANIDVGATELAALERQELEQLRLLAVERCPIMLASKQKAVADIQASMEATRRQKSGQLTAPLRGLMECCRYPVG